MDLDPAIAAAIVNEEEGPELWIDCSDDNRVVLSRQGTTVGEFREFFDTLTLAELRERQDLADQQIGMAYDQRNTRALTELQDVRELLSEAVQRNYGPKIS